MTSANSFCGLRILLVEDDYLIASNLTEKLDGAGVTVIGPAATISRALQLVRSSGAIDGALLDVRLRCGMAFAVADALADRAIPFIFITGYNRAVIPERFATVSYLEKPIQLAELNAALTVLSGDGLA